jgi:Xaa-Pro aminopeptidase
MDMTKALATRRASLLTGSGGPYLLYAGTAPARNFAANTYGFRANSHFLYAAGAGIAGAYLLVTEDVATVFTAFPTPNDALWHGPTELPGALQSRLACRVRDLSELESALSRIHPRTLPPTREKDAAALSAVLGRAVKPGAIDKFDLPLARAMVTARLTQDDLGIDGIREAVDATTEAFAAGRDQARPGIGEATIKARMIARVGERSMTTSFAPIVSVRGEILHNHDSGGQLRDGDLLLVDFGAETRGGWAADVTRTWPVSGTFSPTQRDLYQLVLDAELAAIRAVRPGARYLDVHLTAARVIAQGLVDLNILAGDVDGLVEDGIHALFFPHGVGHLLGLDVHDMEDLGDLAGYAEGRTRSAQFGLGHLRLDRDLTPGMVITIEPGFYQVPAILDDPAHTAAAGDRLRLDQLAKFSDVRGIRIEDDVLVTGDGAEVLTAAIPKEVHDLAN